MNLEKALETVKKISRQEGYAICVVGGLGLYFYDGQHKFKRWDEEEAFLYNLEEAYKTKKELEIKTGLGSSVFQIIKLKK